MRAGLLAILFLPGAALASEELATAECAALYEGHYLYEQSEFDPADVSIGWRQMAGDFEQAARRLGATDADIAQATGRAPDWALAIRAHVLDTDAGAAARYQAQQETCDKLIDRLPEMAHHR